MIEPGVTTKTDQRAEEYIFDNGGVPAFKGYNGFPNTLCMSPDSQIVHGIPNDKPLKEGSILSVDCGVLMNNFYGDLHIPAIGNIDAETKKVVRCDQRLYV